ncbi:MAG: transcriptional repressor LexA [Bacteroidota bacterium]|nr:transcriptional repressor LexA [Bacteroidota bacterium]
MSNLDELDRKGLTFIRNYIRATGKPPSLRAIGHVVKYDSPRSVQLMLKRLASRGLLKYENGEISLAEEGSGATPHTAVVPVIGSVECGLPAFAEQEPEGWVRVSTQIAKPGNNYFILKARGTSMNAARIPIHPKDLVLVRQQAYANAGDLVVALIDNEATIKEYYRQGPHVVLQPRSTDPEHKPIIVTDDLSIQGVVVTVLPNVLS